MDLMWGSENAMKQEENGVAVLASHDGNVSIRWHPTVNRGFGNKGGS